MTRLRWSSLWLVVFLAGPGWAEDIPPVPPIPPADAPEAPAVPVVTLTDKWTVLVNPGRQRPGVIEFTDKSPIQNVDELSLLGPMAGHPFGLGDFAEDGRWAASRGVVQPIEGKNALLHLATADQFELEGIIHQEGFGGWLMLLGWNQGHGYSLSNYTLKESGSPWYVCEYRGDEAIVPTNNEVKQYEWKAEQPFHMTLKNKQLSVEVAKVPILEDYPLENYTAGELYLGTYDTRYGPKPIKIRSLRIRSLDDKPAKPVKPEKKPEKKPAAKKAK